MSAKVAFIGLGVMGFPMAGHLKAKGYEVTVYNRTAAKAQAWAAKHGGKTAATPAAAAKDQDFVMLMVGNDADVIEVALGNDGALAGMKKGAVLIDHTTASADVARKVFEAARSKGIDFIDAPVSGGQAGAENGKLTVMCGGGEAAFERAKPVMDSYARAVTLLGPAGAGQLTKMVNQICIAGLVQGLSEGIAFAEKAGLDANLVLDVISKGAAQSWQMENRGKTMHERKFNFGFAVDWMRKDLGICLAEAKRNGAKLPVTQIVAGYYDEISKAGGNRWDTSSLITRL
jgi:3-hydroxyisobutyrate dehydrogenase-like beta-hydroxyacid dehydrogenase